jgi:hypothetical protein
MAGARLHDLRCSPIAAPARRRRIVVALGVLVVLAAACGSPTAPAGKDTTTSPGSSSSTSSRPGTTSGTTAGGFLAPEVKFGVGQLGAPSPTTSVPTEGGRGRPIDPTNDAGQAVIIAKGGYLLPEWLVADYQLPITWTNLSGAPQQIIFDDAPMHSPVIPQGGTFTWTSPGIGISLTYHTATGRHARLTLQNPNDAS